MQCPRDRNPLRKWRLEQIDAHICPECAGLFIDLDQSGSPALSRAKVRPAERKRIPADGEDPLLSPATEAPMTPFLYLGVEVDYCEESNAVWFDPGELARISPQPVRTERPKKLSSKRSKSEEGLLDGILSGIDAAFTPDLDMLGDFIGGVFDAF